MADNTDTSVADDNLKPTGNDSNTTGSILDQPVPEKSATPDDAKHAEDDQALDEGLKAVEQVIQNYFFIGSNIHRSAIGSDAKVFLGNADKTKKIDNGAVNSKINWSDWFRDKRIHNQAFVIALLFFSGNSPNFVMSMANELVLMMGVRAEPVDETSSIFGRGTAISSLLRDGFAKVNQESINTEAGKLNFDSIVIENSEALSAIKKILLKDYDLVSLRSVIRQWLVNLIKFDSNKIQQLGSFTPDLPRLQAGLGIGLLARTELDALSLIIRPWASSENPNDRLVVGWILLGYFEENSQSAYWSNVSSLLKHWSSLDNYYLRWTAIASTTRLGLIASPEDESALVLSMSVFKEVCKSGKVNLFRGTFSGVLIKSLRFLFGISSYHARTIIIELASWLHDDETILIQDIAAELFVEIVNVTIPLEKGDSDSENISIWELCETESYILSDAIYQLIYRSLVHPKGSFVDYTVNQLSKSIKKLLEREIAPQKVVKNIFTQLREDQHTARYVQLILGGHSNSI